MPVFIPRHVRIDIPLIPNETERERSYTHDSRPVSAEICHQRISNAYLLRERPGSEEDLIQNSYLTPLSPDEIMDIADMARNIWDAIYLTAVKLKEKSS